MKQRMVFFTTLAMIAIVSLAWVWLRIGRPDPHDSAASVSVHAQPTTDETIDTSPPPSRVVAESGDGREPPARGEAGALDLDDAADDHTFAARFVRAEDRGAIRDGVLRLLDPDGRGRLQLGATSAALDTAGQVALRY